MAGQVRQVLRIRPLKAVRSFKRNRLKLVLWLDVNDSRNTRVILGRRVLGYVPNWQRKWIVLEFLIFGHIQQLMAAPIRWTGAKAWMNRD